MSVWALKDRYKNSYFPDIYYLKVSAEFLGYLGLGYKAKVCFASLNGFDGYINIHGSITTGFYLLIYLRERIPLATQLYYFTSVS